jgi:hypothetical protein
MVNVGGFGYNSRITTNERKKMLNTDNWISIPFSAQGVDFISKLDPNGSFYPLIKRLPEMVFESEQTQMISELIGNISNFTREELQAELDAINEGATQALLCLA